jgi:CubicO group peptidase (beta-lactamase class C family)
VRAGAGRVAFATLLAASPLAGQAGPAPAGWTTATGALDALMRTDSVVGGSLWLLRDGHVVRRYESGWADRAASVRVSDSTIFHWGSITKTMTAVALLQLRDRGLVTLDDPITRWVPELRQVHNPYGSMDSITLRMLLSHSSGFQNPTWPYRKYVAWEPFEPTRWTQLVSMMPYQEILFPPGSRYGYSNPGYIYLARVIEAITGDPWQSYIYKNIWRPLDIRDSYFNLTPWLLAPRRSHNYTLVRDSVSGRETVQDNGADFDPGITIPNGGWNAPLGDLATWVSFLSGAAGDVRVIRRATLDEMWRPVVPVGPGALPGDSVGLGFFVMWRDGTRLVGHTGEQAGFRSFFYINPTTRAAVIGAVNTVNEARPEESDAAFKALVLAATDLLR